MDISLYLLQDAIRKVRRVDSSPPACGNNTSSAKQRYGKAVPDPARGTIEIHCTMKWMYLYMYVSLHPEEAILKVRERTYERKVTKDGVKRIASNMMIVLNN